jgi:hypothetical protein
MWRFRHCLFIVLLISAPLWAEVLTQTGALNLTKEAEGLAVTLYGNLSSRPVNSTTDGQARKELLGLCETLRLLRTDLESGIIAPRKNLLLVEKSHQAFLPVQQSLPLDPTERAACDRLLTLLDALGGYHKQVGGQVASPTNPPVTPPPVTPPVTVTAQPTGNWQSTPFPWCQIQGQVKVETGTPPVALPRELVSHSEAVKISGSLTGLRLRPASPIADPSKVALAFLDEDAGRWIVHQADFDPTSGWIESAPNHCSWWRVVTTPFARFKKRSAHFNLHFFGSDDSLANVQTNLDSLEQAWSRIESLGLQFPKNTIDVYYRDLSPEISAVHALGKTAGSWIEINLPARTPKETAMGRKGTVGHELFHEIHAAYEHHLNLGANATIGVNGGRHAFQWLNEALSSWFEFDFIKLADYQGNFYPYSSDFHLKGLDNLAADDGYGGALFIDYLVKLHGRELIATLMRRIQEQGGPRIRNVKARSAVRALADAVFDRGRYGDLKYSDVDGVWEGYLDELMAPKPTAEPRILRRRTLPTELRRGLVDIHKPMNFQQAPLSIGPAQVLAIPRSAANSDGIFELLVNFHTTASFPVFTRVYLAHDLGGANNSILDPSATLLYTLDRAKPGGRGKIQFEPNDQKCIVLLVPFALSGKGGETSVPTQLEVGVVAPAVQTQPPPPQTQNSATYNPQVTGVSPQAAQMLSTVTVHGSDFGPAPASKPTLNSGNAVIVVTKINGRATHVAAPVVKWTPTSITIKVPPANYDFYGTDPSGKKAELVGIAVSRNRKMSNVVSFSILK